MKVVNVPVERLIAYEKNPRHNNVAVESVANSIKRFGFNVPIVITKGDVIVSGHTRYKASQLLGLNSVPCIIADDLTDEQIKAFRLADNKTGELSTWDWELLMQELDGVEGLDMSDFGFDNTEVDSIFEKTKEEMQKNKSDEASMIKVICEHCGESFEVEDE